MSLNLPCSPFVRKRINSESQKISCCWLFIDIFKWFKCDVILVLGAAVDSVTRDNGTELASEVSFKGTTFDLKLFSVDEIVDDLFELDVVE